MKLRRLLATRAYLIAGLTTALLSGCTQKSETQDTLDTSAPVINLIGEQSITLELGHEFVDPGATANDNIDDSVAVSVSGEVNNLVVGDYVLTYTATDTAGNTEQAQRTVKVEDTTPPELTLNGNQQIELEYGSSFEEPGYLASDYGNGEVIVEVSGEVDTHSLGQHILTYVARDESGNVTQAQRQINIVDTTAPVITLVGDQVVNIEYATQYEELGATATDATNQTVTIEISGFVDVYSLGQYTLLYVGRDESGNVSQTNRYINVVDSTAPVLELNGEAFLNLELGLKYEELGATAIDARDGDVDVIISGTVDESMLGDNYVTYSASDEMGNQSQIERTVTVVDTTPPVITLVGEASLTIELGDIYIDQGATAFDTVDGELTIQTSGEIDPDYLGIQTITYEAVDLSGNHAEITRDVLVTNHQPLTLTLMGEDVVNHLMTTDYQDLGARAVDESGNELEVIIEGEVLVNTPGYYTLSYSATGADGTELTVYRLVTVYDEPLQLNYRVEAGESVTIFTNPANDYISSGHVSSKTEDGYLYRYDVDWGDGTVVTDVAANATHTYTEAGDYIVSIVGTMPHFKCQVGYPYRNSTLISVEQWSSLPFLSMQATFKDCESFIAVPDARPDLSLLTDLSEVFADAKLFNDSVSSWFVGNVTNMSAMFAGASSFAGHFSGWDTSNVTDMSRMFAGASAFNGYVSGFDTSNVTTMSGMFAGADRFGMIGNRNIENWDTSNVTDMSFMFAGADNFNESLNGWDTSSVKNMKGMFNDAKAFNHPIGDWNTSNVTDMSLMFAGTGSISLWDWGPRFNQDISGWDTSSVTNMSKMFYENEVFNQPLADWDTSNVIDMSQMFYGATAFNQPIGDWDTSSVTNMDSLFRSAHAFNSDISQWNTSEVTNMYRMFGGATNFNQNIGNWDTAQVTNMALMFWGALSFDQDLSQWDISQVESFEVFLSSTSFSTENYTSLLIGWASIDNLQHDMTLNMGDLQYSSEAEDARSLLINTYGWTITDGGSL